MKQWKVVLSILVLIFSVAVALNNCGGGGDGGGGGGLIAPAANITGTWRVDEGPADSSLNSCDDSTIYHYDVAITHTGTGNSFTLVDQLDFDSYTGTISGTNISYSGPATNSDCPLGFTIAVSLTLNAAGNVASGSASWTCNYSGGSCSGTTAITATKTSGGADTTAPSVPMGLTATAVSTGQINLSWTASTDNVGVTGYKVYRGGVFLKQVASISASDIGLSPATQYCYTVSAVDAAGNESQQSAQQCATTQPGGGCDAAAFNLVSGTWRFTWTSGPNTCGSPEGVQSSWNYELVQNGSSITASPDYSGTLCGNTLTLNGTYAEDGGTTTETITATVSSATAWSGTSNWTWSVSGYSCSGQYSITGSKL